MLAPSPSNGSDGSVARAGAAATVDGGGSAARGGGNRILLAGQRLGHQLGGLLQRRGQVLELQVAIAAVGHDRELVPIVRSEAIEPGVVEAREDVALSLPAGAPHVEEARRLELLTRQLLLEAAHAGRRIDEDAGPRDAQDALSVEHLEPDRVNGAAARALL